MMVKHWKVIDNNLDEWQRAKQDRIAVWCGYKSWTNLKFENGCWYAIPPRESEFMKVPHIASKPPYPGDLPKDS